MKKHTNPHDFQGALEQLEAGESVESAQASLAPDARPNLSLAARLRAAAWPQRLPARIHAQRQRLLAGYTRETAPPPQERSRMKGFKDWRLPAGVAALAVLLLVIGLGVTLSRGGRGLETRQAGDPPGVKMRTYQPAPAEPGSQTALLPQDDLAPNQARLADLAGLVEIKAGGDWQAAAPGTLVSADTRLRTGDFSNLTLVFKDGSLARIGPNSEISIKKLLADPASGERKIVITQISGESNHQVVPLDSDGATYRVNTPVSHGQVKGTQFHLLVGAQGTNWYVDDGSVEVSAQGKDVQVDKGEMTSVPTDQKPGQPVNFISGHGEVTFIGESWVIGDQTFQIHAQTVIQGDPQVGDLVFFEGHFLPDGSRAADSIVLLRRNPANTFSLTGEVQAIDDVLWTVNGQEIAVTDLTAVEPGILVEDLVAVKGIILPDGSLQAEEIRRIIQESGTPFEFTGVVQHIDTGQWQVSGITVTLDANTVVDPGLVVGDAVRVQGTIQEGEVWLASSITRSLDETSAFEFYGEIESMEPWLVSGISFEVRAWTVIDPGLALGELVRVAGQIQPDGTWVAAEIRRYDQALTTVLIGRVFSIDPWVVSGFALTVDQETIIEGEISIGMLVRVEMQLFPDGSHKVVRIAPMDGFNWEMSCQSLVVTLISVGEDTIAVEGWPNLPVGEEVQIDGQLKPGSLVQIMVCYDEDMNVTVAYIIVLFTPQELPPTLTPGEGETGEKVMVCHKPDGKNPHTIVISSSAVPAHLGHGDILGPCPQAAP